MNDSSITINIRDILNEHYPDRGLSVDEKNEIVAAIKDEYSRGGVFTKGIIDDICVTIERAIRRIGK